MKVVQSGGDIHIPALFVLKAVIVLCSWENTIIR